ncbi:MAG: hypothetical protein Q8P35_01565, partial [Candidatus Yanofskybacteria bacterium]|nr:hypothetical protein [Candidatus Yanofskybacteria bacterium]
MNRNLKTVAAVIMAVMVISPLYVVFSGSSNRLARADDCGGQVVNEKLFGTITSNGQNGRATARIFNASDHCRYTVGFASYKINSPNDVIHTQTLFDYVVYEIKPNETIGSTRLNIAVPDCRYQIDVFVGSSPRTPPFYDGNSLLAYAFGGTNVCGAAQITPDPKASRTPTPTLHPTVAPTPTPSIQPGTLSAQCSGNSVRLSWTSGVNANSNSVQKGDFYPNDPDRFWEFILLDPTLAVRSFIDSDIAPGITYSYRIKYGAQVDSNIVSISCGAVTPTPTPHVPGATTLSAVCVGGHAPRVILNWHPVTGQNSNSIQRGDFYPNDPNRFWEFIFLDNAPFQVFSFTDVNVQSNTTYVYRAKTDPNIPSNEVTVHTSPQNCGSVTVPTQVLNVSKTVRNVSSNSEEAETVSARINETVEFTIRVTNVGNTGINNVRVSDALPSGLRYSSGSTTLDGFTLGDGITSGLNIGTFSSNQSRIIRFRAVVENTNLSFVTNIATVSGDNANTVSDTANVSFISATPSGPLSIQKLGRNVSKGTGEQTIVTVSPGDTVEFVIRVRNNSNSTLNNVIVADVLPGGLTYVNGTTTINGIVTA